MTEHYSKVTTPGNYVNLVIKLANLASSLPSVLNVARFAVLRVCVTVSYSYKAKKNIKAYFR